jgi:DNA-binding response OmpR family regulator
LVNNKVHHHHHRKTTGREQAKEIQFGRVRIKRDRHQVFVDEREIILTKKEYELLMYLVVRPNMVFSKEKLYDKIWGQGYAVYHE